MEIEAKFYVKDLPKLAGRLESLGAQIKHPRVLEENWRYDTPDKSLEAEYNLLRLRQAHKVTLTFKGPAKDIDGTSHRTEYETEVSDIEQARNLLGALGYVVTAKYEKYRTEYALPGLTITLDEMPFGNFIEIEGLEIPEIKDTAEKLSLNWDANITENYLTLFSRLKQHIPIEGEFMTFVGLEGLVVIPGMLGVVAADIIE